MPFDGKAVNESHLASGGMPRIGPCPGFEQDGTQQADLEHFPADPVDLDPIANADAVLAHEDKPAKERHDEILQRDGESGAGQAENCCELSRDTEDDEDDEQDAYSLEREAGDIAQATQALLLGSEPQVKTRDKEVCDENREHHHKNREESFQQPVYDAALLSSDEQGPFVVGGAEFL